VCRTVQGNSGFYNGRKGMRGIVTPGCLVDHPTLQLQFMGQGSGLQARFCHAAHFKPMNPERILSFFSPAPSTPPSLACLVIQHLRATLAGFVRICDLGPSSVSGWGTTPSHAQSSWTLRSSGPRFFIQKSKYTSRPVPERVSGTMPHRGDGVPAAAASALERPGAAAKRHAGGGGAGRQAGREAQGRSRS
jgi:hypothetical protein